MCQNSTGIIFCCSVCEKGDNWLTLEVKPQKKCECKAWYAFRQAGSGDFRHICPQCSSQRYETGGFTSLLKICKASKLPDWTLLYDLGETSIPKENCIREEDARFSTLCQNADDSAEFRQMLLEEEGEDCISALTGMRRPATTAKQTKLKWQSPNSFPPSDSEATLYEHPRPAPIPPVSGQAEDTGRGQHSEPRPRSSATSTLPKPRREQQPPTPNSKKVSGRQPPPARNLSIDTETTEESSQFPPSVSASARNGTTSVPCTTITKDEASSSTADYTARRRRRAENVTPASTKLRTHQKSSFDHESQFREDKDEDADDAEDDDESDARPSSSRKRPARRPRDSSRCKTYSQKPKPKPKRKYMPGRNSRQEYHQPRNPQRSRRYEYDSDKETRVISRRGCSPYRSPDRGSRHGSVTKLRSSSRRDYSSSRSPPPRSRSGRTPEVRPPSIRDAGSHDSPRHHDKVSKPKKWFRFLVGSKPEGPSEPVGADGALPSDSKHDRQYDRRFDTQYDRRDNHDRNPSVLSTSARRDRSSRSRSQGGRRIPKSIVTTSASSSFVERDTADRSYFGRERAKGGRDSGHHRRPEQVRHRRTSDSRKDGGGRRSSRRHVQ